MLWIWTRDTDSLKHWKAWFSKALVFNELHLSNYLAYKPSYVVIQPPPFLDGVLPTVVESTPTFGFEHPLKVSFLIFVLQLQLST